MDRKGKHKTGRTVIAKKERITLSRKGRNGKHKTGRTVITKKERITLSRKDGRENTRQEGQL